MLNAKEAPTFPMTSLGHWTAMRGNIGLFSPLISKNDHFAKTGSGQT
jgi:hypothetical protein